MSEHDSRRQFAEAIKHRHPIPVENQLACAGTPDQNFRGGWAEHKYLRRWPVRSDTVVVIDEDRLKFKRQVDWLNARWATGESCWLVLSVGAGRSKEWLVYSAPRARLMNKLTKPRMYAVAAWVGDSDELASQIDSVLDWTTVQMDLKEETVQ